MSHILQPERLEIFAFLFYHENSDYLLIFIQTLRINIFMVFTNFTKLLALNF